MKLLNITNGKIAFINTLARIRQCIWMLAVISKASDQNPLCIFSRSTCIANVIFLCEKTIYNLVMQTL